jgi:phosphatidylglycerol---prolipoprotein diacylglyceryl transferase
MRGEGRGTQPRLSPLTPSRLSRMTVDLNDLADALRWLLLLTGLVWLAYAWVRRVEYRRAVMVLAGLAVVDFLAHAFADWAERSDWGIPTDFSVFSLFILLATVAGLIAAYVYSRSVGVGLATLLDATLVAVIFGGIGARAYHVFTHWDYYSQNTGEIANFGQGGMGLRGALALGLIALLFFALLRRVPFWKLADAGALGLALAQGIGWYGAHLVGANYGVVSDAALVLPFGATGGTVVGLEQDLPDVYGIVAPRVPVQLIAVAFFFALFVALAWMSWRWRPDEGIVFLSYLIVSALGGFALGYWRADETLIWNGWRLDQWVDLALAGIGLVVLGMRVSHFSLFLRGVPEEGK